MRLALFISPRRVGILLTIVVIALSIISFAGQVSTYVIGHGRVFGLVRLFDVGQDSNIPTWYSSIMLLFCSLLLALIAKSQKTARTRYILHWKVLAAIFLYMSIDEVAMIHENADLILGSHISRTGFLHFGWVAVGIPLTIIFVLSYLKFLIHLPKKTRLLFVVAGAIFVSGAIGAEMFAGRHEEIYHLDLTYAMITAVEEFCEMFGIVVFVYALLSYIKEHLQEVNFGIKEAVQAQ
ncbi:hypothetical protein NIES37_30500 [Tolypothrix tenuis PCC 7101]|uniref:Uncharacterized protein n=1 Tax=Tolypothrix tenuis PCC 7101 TaxID=231146 RepID=A0A1Z4N0B8_9CYAN|nr:hypothetical protein NIES37_30500 [Tolypothrix tenuis PCC 7101]BAZ77006.1 hypothetical protein NIES50_56080 [Aulosira laxa NIES-50]